MSVGAQMGTTQKVVVTDMDDCTCFLWEYDKGIVYPPREGGAP